MKLRAIMLSVALLGSAGSAAAQTATDLNNEAARMNQLASSRGESNVIGKISGDFKSFLGSDTNAVVTGLRNGTPINLTRTTTTPSTTGGAPVTTTTTTTITPPTGQMGHGNVYISLALAKQQLSQMGITEPTPQQLQAALTGGSITQTNGTGPTATTTTTQLRGILAMRSEKMGWGKIAQEQGTKLGPVMSSMKSANHSLTTATQPTSSMTTTETASTSKGKGVTAATSGSDKGSSSQIVSAGGKANGNLGQGNSANRGSGSGIVTASGRSGGGNAYGRSGVAVTASGQSGGSSANGSSVGNGGQGSGNGKGHNK